MKILYYKIEKNVELRDIECDDLAGMQELVGGYIECITLDHNKRIVLVCDEEGKIKKNSRYNRYIKHKNGLPIEKIFGDFFVCQSNSDGEFVSVSLDSINVIISCCSYKEGDDYEKIKAILS